MCAGGGGVGGRRLQVARGFRTKASAAEEWSGSPSAVGPVSPAAAASPSLVPSANLLAASPVLLGVVGVTALALIVASITRVAIRHLSFPVPLPQLAPLL